MLENKVLNTIKKYNLIEKNDKIICGISGGPDSICMIDILRKIKEEKIIEFELIVCHLNHMIRKESTDDEKYVESYCEKYDLKFFSKRVDVENIAKNNKQGTEETGRKVRYEFFEEIFEKENANKIAIAHNKNDKVETIIMNIFRGTGIAGLKGIEPKRNNKYLRPLIECERFEIEKYCEENNLNPRIDKTNFENIYTRNKVRNIVIPYIKKEFNPNIINSIDRLANLISEEDQYIEKQTQIAFDKIKILKERNKVILNLKEFNKYDITIKKRLIFYSINIIIGSTKNIEKINIEDIIKMCSKNVGNKYLTPNKYVKISINKGKISVEKLLIKS